MSARGLNQMKTRQLGTLQVSEIGAGAMNISANYGPAADKYQGIKVLREAHQRGVTFFDTAEVYGPYTSEALVGEALVPIRDSVRIATRFGFDIEGGTGGLNSRPDHVKAVVDASLKRLRTDRIDHGEGPRKNGVLHACEELGIGFVPWGPLGMGYLTGKITATTKLDPKLDLRSGFDRFSPDNIAANMPIVDLLTRFAATKNATPVQVALAWLLARKPFIVPIAGTRNSGHLRENLEALDVQLTPADVAALDADFSKLTVHGGRMNEMQMRAVKRAG